MTHNKLPTTNESTNQETHPCDWGSTLLCKSSDGGLQGCWGQRKKWLQLERWNIRRLGNGIEVGATLKVEGWPDRSSDKNAPCDLGFMARLTHQWLVFSWTLETRLGWGYTWDFKSHIKSFHCCCLLSLPLKIGTHLSIHDCLVPLFLLLHYQVKH